MAETNLQAKIREEQGKGPSRRLRSQGLIPAVLYGRKQKSMPLSINPTELYKVISAEGGANALIHLKISGNNGDQDTTVLLKDIQIDSIKRCYVHADFLQVNVEDEVKVSLPILLVGKSIGVKEGGIMQQIRRQLEIYCRAGSIPQKMEADVSGLAIGDSLHLNDLTLPEGVRSAHLSNVTIAVCIPPAEEEVVETPVAAALTEEGVEAAPGETPPGEAPKEEPGKEVAGKEKEKGKGKGKEGTPKKEK